MAKLRLKTLRINNNSNKTIEYYYKIFYINTTKDFREMLLENNDLESIQNELNAAINLSAIETAKKHHQKMQKKCKSNNVRKDIYFRPKFENEFVALRPEYIQDTIKLASRLIDWHVYAIDFQNIANDKYTLLEALSEDSDDSWGILYLDDELNQLFG